MIIDRQPSVQDSDEDIRDWAKANGYSKYPIAYIPLQEAVTPDTPDVAEIKFMDPECPVKRFVGRMGHLVGM